MVSLSRQQRLDLGMRAATTAMVGQDKVWSRYSNDKVDIAHALVEVIRKLHRDLPADSPLAALSLGSSSEPQFRILESAFRGGLWLVDIEQTALNTVAERIARQGTDQVRLIGADYRALLASDDDVRRLVARELGGRRVELITLHHSLYYSTRDQWPGLVARLFEHVLADQPCERPGGVRGVIHAVLMTSRTDDPTSTTWLYNHFAGRFFAAHNDQDLAGFGAALALDARFRAARIAVRSSTVRFWTDDFAQFMGAIWMILLHPNVHRFNEDQQREVIEFVYDRLFEPRVPLTQVQDHLYIERTGD